MKCQLCDRENVVNFHHFIPRTLHKNKWFKKNFTRKEMMCGIDLCKHDCHKEIHKLISEKELGRYYYTKSLLLSHPTVRGYVKWVKNQNI